MNNNISQCDEQTFELQIPLNIIKDIIMFCLPNTEIDNNAVLVINQSLNYFLKVFAQKIKYENNTIMIKNIKKCITSDKRFYFLKKLTEK